MFSVGAGLPRAFIVLPRSLWLAALLALLGLVGGIVLLRWRLRALTDSPAPAEEETFVPELIERQPTPRPVVVAPPVAKPASATVKVDPSIFRAYDIRGVVGQTLSREVAYLLGQSIGMLM
ncbi:MAG: phosphomannomutase/phosphoglucomutase, partial [Rhodanobacter sp.]